ncbi:MAG: hypothetical protein OEU25_12775, partial [Rhodospirillales bacterium]|nr:hypothetical protein [Rhodospirillales bacterium]
ATSTRFPRHKALLEGISFPAYRRTSTLIRLHAKSGNPGLTRAMTIDPSELDAALKRDQAPAEIPARPSIAAAE